MNTNNEIARLNLLEIRNSFSVNSQSNTYSQSELIT